MSPEAIAIVAAAGVMLGVLVPLLLTIRADVRADIRAVRADVRAVETSLDARLRAVETELAYLRGLLQAPERRPPTPAAAEAVTADS